MPILLLPCNQSDIVKISLFGCEKGRRTRKTGIFYFYQLGYAVSRIQSCLAWWRTDSIPNNLAVDSVGSDSKAHQSPFLDIFDSIIIYLLLLFYRSSIPKSKKRKVWTITLMMFIKYICMGNNASWGCVPQKREPQTARTANYQDRIIDDSN